jgi:hypothetical protein
MSCGSQDSRHYRAARRRPSVLGMSKRNMSQHNTPQHDFRREDGDQRQPKAIWGHSLPAAIANHALTVVDRAGEAHRLVLRRWARPEWIVEDPTPPRSARRRCSTSSPQPRCPHRSSRLPPVRRSLLKRVHNPRNRRCMCDPTCWCRRSRIGHAFRWYVPSRFHRLGTRRRRSASFAGPS